MEQNEIAKRIFLFLGTIALIVLIVSLFSTIYTIPTSQGPQTSFEQRHPEYNLSTLSIDKIEKQGKITPSPELESNTILIDKAHGNSFQSEDIQPLTSALIENGHEIRILREDDDIGEKLSNSDIYVVIDPTDEYTESETNGVKQFVDQGGRLLLVGEPNRKQIQIGLLATQVVTQRSALTTIGSKFGISFGTNYLYNLEEKDGNYQNIIAKTPNNKNIEDINRTVMHTATMVESSSGSNILVTTQGTQKSGTHQVDRYSVAIQKENIIAIGDKSIFSDNRYNIADNEDLISYIIDSITGRSVSGQIDINIEDQGDNQNNQELPRQIFNST